MAWLDRLRQIEAFDGIEFDPALLAAFEAAPTTRRIRFHTPSFKTYRGCELAGCGKNSFPAFSVTAGACALQCDHCRAGVLAPMIAATSPEMLEEKVEALVLSDGLRGFLLSGGSNRRNEIAYERFWTAVRRIKARHPYLRIAAHTALLDDGRARAMEAAGVDVAMMDVIGSADTIRDVYHLDRPVSDFEASLAALRRTRMRVVPHIVIGLHHGRIRGEAAALEIVARQRVDALVLVIVMPHFAARETPFSLVPPARVAEVFRAARARLGDTPVLLGCARPSGLHKRAVDAYAVMAGVDGIAFPAEGAVALARTLHRPFEQHHACCSIAIDAGGVEAGLAADLPLVPA